MAYEMGPQDGVYSDANSYVSMHLFLGGCGAHDLHLPRMQ